MFHFCFTPFIHFPMMFPSLSYIVPFHLFPSLNSPTYLFPLYQVKVPRPFSNPSLNFPTYFPPSRKVEVPWPFGIPPFNSPLYFAPLGKVKFPCSFFSLEKINEENSKKERVMSKCFTWFTIGWFRWNQYIPEFGGFFKNVWRIPQRTPNMRNIIFLTDIVSAYTDTLRKY